MDVSHHTLCETWSVGAQFEISALLRGCTEPNLWGHHIEGRGQGHATLDYNSGILEIGYFLRCVLQMTKGLGHDSLSMLFGESLLVLSTSSHASRRVVVKFLSFSSGLKPV